MGHELLGRIEYELDAAGKRTGRWRPRAEAAFADRQNFAKSAPEQRWRRGKRTGTEPVEIAKK